MHPSRARAYAAIELEEWEGKGIDFYHKFAGDPKRGGVLYIRETEEPYSGTITALDDRGRKRSFASIRKRVNTTALISNGMNQGNLMEESNLIRAY